MLPLGHGKNDLPARNLSVFVEAGGHQGRIPVRFDCVEILTCLVLAIARVVFLDDRSGFEENNLGNSPTDNKRNDVISRVVGDLHRPAVDEPDITPTGALTDLDEVTAHRRASFHHGSNVIFATDELFGVSEYRLARSEHDQFVFSTYSVVPVEVVLLKGFFGKHSFFYLVGTPDMFHVVLCPDVVQAVVVLRRLFAEEVLSQRDIVA